MHRRQRWFVLQPGWVVVLFSLSLLMGCQPAESVTDETQQKIIYGLTLVVSGIDPHINQSAELGIILRQVYDTLVYRHPETKDFVPGLAESWTISADGLTYTFNLRKGVTFHDGTPFNAEAVAANLARILNPETQSQKARLLLGPIRGYQVLDPYTIQMNLAEPFAPLLDSLSQVYLGMASPAALAEYDNLRYQFHQVGTGPFRFVDYIPETYIILQRNYDYAWGPEFYNPIGNDAVEEIEYRFYLDEATRAINLEQDNAQIMGEILPLDARTVANDADLQLLPVPVPGQPLQFYFNTQQVPTDILAIRQALSFATNRNAITDAVFQGFSPVAWGPLSSETLFYNPGVRGVYDYNVEQAQNLLSAAGYADSDDDGLLDRNGETLEVRIIQPAWGHVPEVTQLLQDQWRSIGVRAIIEPVPGYTALIEKINEGDYNLVSFDQFGLDPAFINAYYLSNGDFNWTGYSNPELDQLLLDAVRTNDSNVRRQLYGQIQAIIMQQALILPIRDYVNLNGSSNRIRGLRFDPYGWFPLLHDVALEEPVAAN